MDREHLLSAVLADDTRYGIYRHVAERPGETVSVAEVAARFRLHPNVARMHLGKLERAGFLVTSLRMKGTGGRPAKLYSLSGTVTTFAFPPRRYELLASLALAALAETGAPREVERICRAAGRAEGRRFLTANGLGRVAGRAAIVGSVRAIAETQGLLPEVYWQGDELRVDVHNCVFREATGGQADLACAMHRSYLEGVIEAVVDGSDSPRLAADGAPISCGGDACRLSCLPTGAGTGGLAAP